jgi:hypothetical protein
MQEQTSSESAAAPLARWGWVASATGLGVGPWIALALTGIGWFALDTLQVKWGLISQGVRFVDMESVIAHPARLFSGLAGDRNGIAAALFTSLAIAALISPVALSARRSRFAWLGCCAPLVLMLCVALILKLRTSGDLFRENGWVDTLGNDARHFANHVFRGASAAVAQKISVASGGYLALLSSAYLAGYGITRIRKNSAFRGEAR